MQHNGLHKDTPWQWVFFFRFTVLVVSVVTLIHQVFAHYFPPAHC